MLELIWHFNLLLSNIVMKTILQKILILHIVIGFVSCSDFLETTPTSVTPETYFKNKEEVKSFLISVYAPLIAETFYGGDYAWQIAAEDLGYYSRTSATGSVVSGSTSISDVALQNTWRILYDGINRANMMLENIDRAIPAVADSAVREQYKSEARFLRAFYYFTLIENFGDLPFRTNTPTDINSLSLARTNKEIIYDFIISEMIASEPYLPTANQVNPGHVTKSALQGILARVYLFRAGEGYRESVAAPGSNVLVYFAEAKKWALKVKNSGLHGLVSPYSQIFIDLAADKYNSTGVKESIWEVEAAGNRSTTILAAGRIGNKLGFGGPDLSPASGSPYANETGLANPGMSYGYVYCTLRLYDMYESEKDTARGNWNIAPFSYTTTGSASTLKVTGRKYFYGKKPASLSTVNFPYTDAKGFVYSIGNATDTLNTSRCIAKYRREYEQVVPKNRNYTPINFPMLRYSDVLLMIAEADNELNDVPSNLAYECLNAVRNRAKIAAVEVASLSKSQFREVIKKERAMELCYEGTRRFDLIRWGDYVKSMNDLAVLLETNVRWPLGVKYAANYFKINKYYLYLPIPAYELSVNKAILNNNPGW
jgi:hypothetical protein